MLKDYEEFISKRCEKALLNNKEYIELQQKLAVAKKNQDIDSYSDITVSIQIVVEQVVYRTGVKDMLMMMS